MNTTRVPKPSVVSIIFCDIIINVLCARSPSAVRPETGSKIAGSERGRDPRGPDKSGNFMRTHRSGLTSQLRKGSQRNEDSRRECACRMSIVVPSPAKFVEFTYPHYTPKQKRTNTPWGRGGGGSQRSIYLFFLF